jgi:SAM-dependent methyltransferase
MTETRPTPERIMQLSTGVWATALVASAATHSVFAHLEAGEDTVEKLAKRAEISERGAQSLLDGLLGLGLVTFADGSYRSTAEASAYLVEGRPGYAGGFAQVQLAQAGEWSQLPTVVRTGKPVMRETHDSADNQFFEQLVPALAPLSAPVATFAAQVVGVAGAGEVSILDVGGGSGIYSAVWLGLNPNARSTQLDWAGVNAIARRLVESRGFGERFSSIDGDLRTTDFGESVYDLAIYSHVAHVEGPEENIAVLTKLRRALKPGGTLLISDFIPDDDRGGPPFPLIFASVMLLHSEQGNTWRRADYQRWLAAAGFTEVTFQSTPTPTTLVIAR